MFITQRYISYHSPNRTLDLNIINPPMSGVLPFHVSSQFSAETPILLHNLLATFCGLLAQFKLNLLCDVWKFEKRFPLCLLFPLLF